MGRRRRARGRRLPILVLLLILLAAGALAWRQLADAPAAAPADKRPVVAEGSTLRIHYVDVGQGDGTIWEFPDGTIVIYDCGPPPPSGAMTPLVRYLRETLARPEGSTLWALIASHGHLDHIGGCSDLLSNYQVLHVYETWYDGEDSPSSYHRFLDDVRAEGAALHTLGAREGAASFGTDDAIQLPTSAGARATILWPSSMAARWDDIGQASIVIRLSFGATGFCFQGDIEEAQEHALARALGQARCDVLLAGHHGSRHASTAEWLSAARPGVMIASFGENSFGHPTSEALCRMQQAGATVYATQRAGSIVVQADGAGFAVTTGSAETRDYCAPDAKYAL